MNEMNEDGADATNRAQQKRKDLAASKRARIIAQMTALQKNFIEQNIQLCSEIQETSPPIDESSPSPGNYQTMTVESKVQSCLGNYTNDSSLSSKPMVTCIFCQESSEIKLNGEALVLSAYVQK